MKNARLFLFVILIAITSCKKSSIGEDFGCITRVEDNQNNYTINAADYATAVRLFQQNDLSYNNLRWYEVQYDTVHLNGVANHYVHVRGEQFLNGLPIIGCDLFRHFENGIWYSVVDRPITSTALDTIPGLQLAQVRKLYVDQLYANKSKNDFTNYKDSCLVAEFGYYDLNYGNYTLPINLVKVWLVTPLGHNAPSAFFNDNGSLIGYSDGIFYSLPGGI